MAKYIKNYVTGHGITFINSKRNLEALEKASSLWRDMAPKINLEGLSITMVCGAKSNGKSSLLRYLVNSYVGRKSKACQDQDELEMMDDSDSSEGQLKSNKQDDRYAYYIDYDPGQSELTSPGIISAHIIKATAPPLQSPTYLNVGQHEPIAMSSVGGLNMSVNPRMYIANCRHVLNKVIEHRESQAEKQPIFINTMGHIRNVGLAMLTDLIKICRPTNLIVLNVEADPLRTIFADLSPNVIDNTSASFYYDTNQITKNSLKYKYETYNLPFTCTESTSIANKNRTALQLAYMASIPEAIYKPVMQLSTKWVSFDKVSVFCVSSYPLKEAIVLELLYHSWVHFVKVRQSFITNDKPEQGQHTEKNEQHDAQDARGHGNIICRILDEVNENDLYGCGIVAEIDLDKKMMAVISPLDQETLDTKVNCVIKPLSIQVPPQMVQHDIYGYF